MKVTKIQLSDCIQKILKINTTGMTTDQMIKIIKNIISPNVVLPHCSLPIHNYKDQLCLSTDELKQLAKKNKIKVSQTRENLCKELESKELVKIIRKSPELKKKTKLSPVKYEPEQGESISLLISSHGGDILDSVFNKQEFKNIKVAYRIPHDTLNFYNKEHFDVLKMFFIEIEPVFDDKKIMDMYIENCNYTKKNEQSYKQSYKYYYDRNPDQKDRFKSPVSSMIKNKKECYIGHVIVNRNFWFGDKKWEINHQRSDFKNINPPFMGHMFVLRAIQKDGSILQGELLSEKKKDGLDYLRKTVQDIILSNYMYIDFMSLLPILQKLYKNIYIYDFACRTSSLKTERKVRQDIYNKEKQPFDL
jgi:SpoVK/Ycf46/Vps4 family AAA+-type ATPase